MKRKKVKVVMPSRATSPATTRLAEAPIRVKLPAEARAQRERPPQRLGGRRVVAAGLGEPLYHGDHGRREGDVVHDAGGEAAAPHHDHGRPGQGAGGGGQRVRHHAL